MWRGAERRPRISPRPRLDQRGMTLLEMLVAVTVVAIVGLAISVLTVGAVRAERGGADTAAALRAVQTARARIEADVRRSRAATAAGTTLELTDRDGGVVRYSVSGTTLVRQAGSAATTVAQGFDLVEFAWLPDPGLVQYRLRAAGPGAAGQPGLGDPVEVEGRTALRLPPGGRP